MGRYHTILYSQLSLTPPTHIVVIKTSIGSHTVQEVGRKPLISSSIYGIVVVILPILQYACNCFRVSEGTLACAGPPVMLLYPTPLLGPCIGEEERKLNYRIYTWPG